MICGKNAATFNSPHLDYLRAAWSAEKGRMGEEINTGGQPDVVNSGSESNPHASVQAEPKAPAETRDEVDESKRSRRRWRFWIVIALLFVLALFLVHHFSKETASTSGAAGARGQQGPAAITAGQSVSGDINIYVNRPGHSDADLHGHVYSQITGQVMAVHYREGQMVRKGDPLIDIDPRPYQATADAGGRKSGARSGSAGGGAHGSGAVQGQPTPETPSPNSSSTTRSRRSSRAEGTVKADQGHGGLRPGATGLLPHRLRRSADRSGFGWWTRETPSFRAAAPCWW